jgi:hypothetical protein
MRKHRLFFAAAFIMFGTFGVIAYNIPHENTTSGLREADNDNTVLQETEGIDTMQVINGAFAIHNVETGKNLRPYNAGVSNGNRIILYPHNEWKCLTWRFNHIEGTTCQLQNLYTEKTFEPKSDIEAGVALWQQPLKKDRSQYWEFIEQPDETYLIRLKETELYITFSSDKTDSNIILMPYQNSSDQQWKLIEQYPPF